MAATAPPRMPCTSRPRRARASRAALLVLAATVVGLAGCSGDRPTLGAVDPEAPTTTTSTTAVPPAAVQPTEAPTTTTPVGIGAADLLGFIASPKGDPVVHARPDPSSPRLEVPSRTALGAPTVFAVVGDPVAPSPADPGWIRVLLPTRPNGSTGWVAAGSVDITRTTLRIVVDLAARELRVEDGDAVRVRAEIAVGTSQNPTPVGPTYVTELVDNVEPAGAYGPWALGLALHSETLSEFAGGPGQVGIHGTNRPELIGEAVSHGCVRLANEDIQAVVDLQLPLGVPVVIT